MKILPIIRSIKEAQEIRKLIEYRLIYTGQHYKKNMSESFFVLLGIPAQHAKIVSGEGTQSDKTCDILIRFEKELLNHPTNVVLVVGVASTLA
jgi:UDP-N-acetylglucosamine 2-epimerase (non-hydrolysing)